MRSGAEARRHTLRRACGGASESVVREMAPWSGSNPSRRFLLRRVGAAAAALPFGFAASNAVEGVTP